MTGHHFNSDPAYFYLLACQRYTELNPVRAAMMRHPRQYRWSSYRANAEGKSGDLVTPHDQYLRLGRSADARREAYRELFHAAPDEAVVENIRRGSHRLSGRRARSSTA